MNPKPRRKHEQDTKQVGIWIRVSTEEQAESESPEHHEERARYYAQAKGWKVREVYHLEAVSGKSVFEHPETKRMIEDITKGHISALIFSKLARLARNTRELLDFADLFREQNADLVSLQESIDTSTPAGRLFYTLIAAMAEWEREEIASRVAASVPIRAKLGKPLGGQGSFGYIWKEGKLVVEPKEAPVRKLIYELFKKHQRKKTVAKMLNDQGYRTRKGARFSDTTIRRLIEDPTAKGEYRANYTKSLGEGKKWVVKPEEDWVIRKVEPVVSIELWEECNAILAEQAKNKRPTKRAVHLFTGYAFCHCGAKMYVPSNNPKYTCYKCHNKITPTDLEAVYHHELQSFLFSKEEVASYEESERVATLEKQTLLRNQLSAKERVKREMEKTHKLYLDDQISPEGFGEIYKPLEKRLKELDEEIPRLEGEIDFLKVQEESRNQVLEEAQSLFERWKTFSSDEKRRVVETITEKIIVAEEEITIALCYLPNPSIITSDEQRDIRGSWRRPA